MAGNVTVASILGELSANTWMALMNTTSAGENPGENSSIINTLSANMSLTTDATTLNSNTSLAMINTTAAVTKAIGKPIRCLRMPRRDPDYLRYADIFGIYLCSIVIVFGLVGNTLAFLTFTKERNSSTVLLFKTLALVDSMVLVFYAYFQVYFGLFRMFEMLNKDRVFMSIFPYMSGLKEIFETLSVWIPLVVAFERYIAVCWPFKAKTLCTLKKTVIALSVLVVLALGLNLVMFWSYQVKYYYDRCTKLRWPYSSLSVLGRKEGFQIGYKTIAQPLLRLVLPFSFLCFLNARLIIALCRASKERSQLSSNQNQRAERSITIAAVSMIIVLLVCQTLAVVRSIMAGIGNTVPGVVTKGFVEFFQKSYPPAFFLVALNSAINFFIYVVGIRRFRENLFKIITCACAKSGSHGDDTSGSNTATLKTETSHL